MENDSEVGSAAHADLNTLEDCNAERNTPFVHRKNQTAPQHLLAPTSRNTSEVTGFFESAVVEVEETFNLTKKC